MKHITTYEKFTESADVNEAMVQIAGKDKPAGAKVLGQVIADFLQKEGMLDSKYSSGKGKQLVEVSLANFIMDNTF